METDLGFSAKSYGEISLKHIGVCHPIVYMKEEGNSCFGIKKSKNECSEEKIDLWQQR